MYSVIMPVLNKEPHLRRSIGSVLAQEGSQFELIIVDDGSVDGGLELAEAFARVDNRIRVVRRGVPGPGGYAARNVGIREAKHDWIGFLDADDEWKPGFLAEIDRVRFQFPGVRFISAAYMIAERDDFRRLCRFASCAMQRDSRIDARLVPLVEFVASARKGRWPAHTSSVFAERSSLVTVGGFPEGRCARGGDRDTWLRLAIAVPYAWTPFVGAVYNRDSVNMVTRTTAHPSDPCVLGTIDTILGSSGSDALSRTLRRELILLHNNTLLSYFSQKRKTTGLTFTDLRKLRRGFDLRFAARFARLILLSPKRRIAPDEREISE